MISDISDAQKMDILLSFIGKGYNLLDTDDPATMKMELGNGYTLFASINQPWMVEHSDKTENIRRYIESTDFPYTNMKDALTLHRDYEAECKRVLEEKGGKPKQERPKNRNSLKTSKPAGKKTKTIDYAEQARLEREKNEKILEALENGEIQPAAKAHQGVA